MTDVIFTIAEVASDAPREHRPAVREAAQASYEALFAVPADDPVPGITRAERHLFAARAAYVDGDPAAADWYLAEADAIADAEELVAEGADGAAAVRAGRRVRAALRHVDLLIVRPAAATRDDLHGLEAAGFTAAEIVVLSQIASFVSYQVRVAHALRVIEESA